MNVKKNAIKKANEDFLFLKDHPEWSNDKEVALAAVQKNGYALQYASDKLKNDKVVVLAAVQENGFALEFASKDLKKDKKIILAAIRNDINAYVYSELKGYKMLNAILRKEGEEFLLSCWNNKDLNIRFEVANHHNFLPTEKQIELGLGSIFTTIRQVYELRKDEWLAKIEENKLRNTI